MKHIPFSEAEAALKESQSKRSIKFKDEAEKILNDEMKSLTEGFNNKIDFPQFGTSPGPSPTPSPPSTPQTLSYFSVSEVSVKAYSHVPSVCPCPPS